MGIWLCGVCFKTHTLRAKCRHGADFVSPPDIGDGFVRFVLYDLTKPLVPPCSQLDLVDGLLHDQHDGFTLSLLDSLFSKGLRTVKSIPPKCHLGFSQVLKGALDKGVPGGSWQLVRETLTESASPMLDLDEENLDLSEQNLKQCKRKIYDVHYTTASALSLPDIPIDHHQLIASQDVVLDRIKSFPRGMSCGRDGLRAQHLMDGLSGADVAISDELVSSITQVANLFLERKCPMMLGEYIGSAPLTPLVKPGGGIRPIAVGTIWRRLVSKVSATLIGHSLDGYLDGLQFGVGVPEGGEAIIHAINCLVEDRGDDVGLSMLLVDFQNAFNLVDRTIMLEEVRLRCPAISRWVEFCYSSPARLYYGEHFLWSCQGVQQGDPLGPLLFSLVLHPLICKIRDSFNLCLHAWYLDDGTIVGDTLVVGKVLELITEDGPRCGLHLNIDKTELFWPKEDPRSRLEGVFPPNISRPLHGVKLLGGPVSVDADFSSALVMKRVSKTIGILDTVAKINDPQSYCHDFWTGVWRLAMETSHFTIRIWGLGVYLAGDVLNYAFIASHWQSAALQTKLLRHVDIVALGSTFDDALCVFNNAMGIDFLSNSREMALWKSQREEHTSERLRVVPISRLGQTMNGKTYRCVLCYRLGVPLFLVSKSCSACSKVFTGDVYGDHDVSCAGFIGIKHQHNAVRDTLVGICFRSGISAGKEVEIGLGGGRDKGLRPTGMADFVPGRAVIDAAQRKRVKYMTKCADIRYGFLPFSFSSFGELEKDVVTLLKRVRKFSMAKDIGARAAVHIFNKIGFSIAKGVGAQIVPRLPSNLL
ncbi:putative reverse transcriptase domain-containing protein [Tanacetum coccineum]